MSMTTVDETKKPANVRWLIQSSFEVYRILTAKPIKKRHGLYKTKSSSLWSTLINLRYSPITLIDQKPALPSWTIFDTHSDRSHQNTWQQ